MKSGAFSNNTDLSASFWTQVNILQEKIPGILRGFFSSENEKYRSIFVKW